MTEGYTGWDNYLERKYWSRLEYKYLKEGVPGHILVKCERCNGFGDYWRKRDD